VKGVALFASCFRRSGINRAVKRGYRILDLISLRDLLRGKQLYGGTTQVQGELAAGPPMVLLGNPMKEASHARAFAPHQEKKFARAGMRGGCTEECFQSPLKIGRLPRAQAVTLAGDPVVAQRIEHGNGSVLRRAAKMPRKRTIGRMRGTA